MERIEVTNPLYAPSRPSAYTQPFMKIKNDHPGDESMCSICRGVYTSLDAMTVTFTEESTDEEDRPGSPAAVPAADGSQPLSEPLRFVTGTLGIELDPFQRAIAERVLDYWQPGALGHRDHPVPDDLEPELDPERVVHSVDEPYAVHQPHSYADAVESALQLRADAALDGSAFYLARNAAEDGA